jgi:hypothetical protein
MDLAAGYDSVPSLPPCTPCYGVLLHQRGLLGLRLHLRRGKTSSLLHGGRVCLYPVFGSDPLLLALPPLQIISLSQLVFNVEPTKLIASALMDMDRAS